MNATNPNWTLIVALFIVLIVAAVAAWAYTERRKRSERLQRRFGPEYARTVERLGSRTKAEAELAARERRVDSLHIVPLTAVDAARFRQSWNMLQGRFVDDPESAVAQADRLVSELMLKRGYPMGDFEHRAADVSVDHPAVVANYRAARTIAVRDEKGQATTEDLREAVVHYRALFEELLEIGEPPPGGAPPKQPSQHKHVPVQS